MEEKEDASESDFLRIDLTDNVTVIVNCLEADAKNDEIMKQHQIVPPGMSAGAYTHTHAYTHSRIHTLTHTHTHTHIHIYTNMH